MQQQLVVVRCKLTYVETKGVITVSVSVHKRICTMCSLEVQ